jgi:hypothetical protein
MRGLPDVSNKDKDLVSKLQDIRKVIAAPTIEEKRKILEKKWV